MTALVMLSHFRQRRKRDLRWRSVWVWEAAKNFISGDGSLAQPYEVIE